MKLTGTYNGKPIELELTEEQIKVLEQADKKKTGWERAEQSQTYYVNYSDGYVSATESFDNIDANRYEKANYFLDKALAKDIQRAQTLQRKLWRRSAELCDKVDWENLETIKFYICYDYIERELDIDAYCNSSQFGQVCFDTKAHAKQAIEEFHDELIWYFTKFKSRMD